MTRSEFRERCIYLRRQHGDTFPLATLIEGLDVQTLLDPLVNRCFVHLQDGMVGIAISQTLTVSHPEEYLSDLPDEVQSEVVASLEAALGHLRAVQALVAKNGVC